MNITERRKSEISAMTRKELNAHAFLCEQEQEEYEKEIKTLQSIISQLEENHKHELQTLIIADNTKIWALEEKVTKQKAEIERLTQGHEAIVNFKRGEALVYVQQIKEISKQILEGRCT